jgi:serine/threonine-protein kinase
MLGEWDDLAHDEPVIAEPILTRVADYDVLRVLGRGGMGVVCRARDRLLGREVALKLIHSGVLASDEELRRFRLEAETVASLRHPNLIVIHEAGEADGQPYFTMTLADGGTLAKRLSDLGHLEPVASAKLVHQIALAVHHAHMRGILHRDLKPANILFDSDEQPIVSDFGLARFAGADSVTKSGALLGTPAYLAPEVASGAAAHTTSSDVYALGVILFECLTGRTPFANDAPLALLKSITEDEPPAPSSLAKNIDRDLEAVCLRALEKDPSRRYPTAEALAKDLALWLADEPVTARHPPFSERLWRWAERNQSRAVLYSMAAMTLFILVVLSAVMNVVMSTEQSRTAEAMHRSEVLRAMLLRDYAVQLMQSPDSMLRALPHLEEAAGLTTDSVLQNQAIQLRLRVVNRLAPRRLAQWKTTTAEPQLAWSPDSLVAACIDGTKTRAYDLQQMREGDPSHATLFQTSPTHALTLPNDRNTPRRRLDSPDGRSVLVSSRDGVILFTAPTALPEWHGGGLLGASFDSQSRLLLAFADRTVQLQSSGALIDVPSAETSAVAASATENQITTSIEKGGIVHVWRGEPQTQELCAPLTHNADVTKAVLDPTRRYVATLAADKTLRVWEIATAMPITPPLPIAHPHFQIAIDGNTQRLALWDEGTVQFFDW